MTIEMKLPPKGAVTQQARHVHEELSKLKAGQALVIMDTHNSRMLAYRVAQRMGISITTRKLNGKGIGVWRTDLI